MIMLLTFVHIAVALVLILVVLLQSARGTDLAGAFGGMGSQTAFGPRGTTTFLSKTTAGLAAVFMVTSLSLAVLSNRTRRSGSVLSGEKAVPAKAQPQVPGLPAGVPVPQIPGLPPGVKQTIEVIPPTPPAGAPPAGAVPAPEVKVAPAKPPATTPAPSSKAVPKSPPSSVPDMPPPPAEAPAPAGQ